MEIIFNDAEKLNENDICSICLDNLDDIKNVLECKRCKNQFHKICLDKWIEHKESCPYCRYKVNFENDLDLEIINSVLIYSEFSEMSFYFNEIGIIYFLINNIIKTILYGMVFFFSSIFIIFYLIKLIAN